VRTFSKDGSIGAYKIEREQLCRLVDHIVQQVQHGDAARHIAIETAVDNVEITGMTSANYYSKICLVD
jgi:hypothetical protein